MQAYFNVHKLLKHPNKVSAHTFKDGLLFSSDGAQEVLNFVRSFDRPFGVIVRFTCYRVFYNERPKSFCLLNWPEDLL